MNKTLLGAVLMLGIGAGYISVYGWPVKDKVITDTLIIEYHYGEPSFKDDIGVKHLTVKDIEEMI